MKINKIKKDFKNLSKDLNKLQEQINLSKKFPGYFNKNIIRFSFVFMLLFTAWIFYIEDFNFKFVYAECDKQTPCNNPFYICKEEINYSDYFNQKEVCIPKNQVPKELKEICQTGVCDKQFIQPGEVIGQKPSHWVLNYNTYIIIILLIFMTINHLYYKLKKRC